jgi:Mg2+/citrate symporter
MIVWTIIVMVLALIGIATNLLWGNIIKVPFHDIILFLIALGILVRIRYKSKEAEKEKLQEKVAELGSEEK